MTDIFFDTENSAKKLGNLSPRTLEKWRVTGEGPAFRKFGKKVLYSESDLQDWADARKHISTSQE